MIEFISQSQPLANLLATFPAIPCNHEKQKPQAQKDALTDLAWFGLIDLVWFIWFDSFDLIDMIALIDFIYWQLIRSQLRNARSLSLNSSQILADDLSFCWSARSSASVSWSKSKSSNPWSNAETFKPIMSHPPVVESLQWKTTVKFHLAFFFTHLKSNCQVGNFNSDWLIYHFLTFLPRYLLWPPDFFLRSPHNIRRSLAKSQGNNIFNKTTKSQKMQHFNAPKKAMPRPRSRIISYFFHFLRPSIQPWRCCNVFLGESTKEWGSNSWNLFFKLCLQSVVSWPYVIQSTSSSHIIILNYKAPFQPIKNKDILLGSQRWRILLPPFLSSLEGFFFSLKIQCTSGLPDSKCHTRRPAVLVLLFLPQA